MAIIGAGAVGMRYAYSLMIKDLARSIVILDLNEQKAEGEVMDLNHGMPYVSPIEIASGQFPDLKGSDLVVITCGAKQKPGQTRMDLINENIKIFKNIIPQVVKYAEDALFLVVTNPVDILSYATYKISGKPWQQVIGSGTVLDSARFRYLFSRCSQVDSRNIHAYILGEHGDTEFPVWSKAMVGGMKLDKFCPVCYKCGNPEATRKNIFEEVKNSAYKIIEKKGETSYGIGLAVVRITQAILKDENAILPVSVLVNDYYDISDVYLSVPSVVNKTGIREILPIVLAKKEVDNLHRSADALRTIISKSGF